MKYSDGGVGDFLVRAPQLSGNLNPSAQWANLAPSFKGKFKVPTLRNVDKRPRPDFVKAYMHNGYLKSLKEVATVLARDADLATPRLASAPPGRLGSAGNLLVQYGESDATASAPK